ncbi:hypothetical protein [Streptomyces platensis]|uniref:hypothetical protein n=1 Tax=Streptomyces platensis TaxID=58346 RepID=UPI001F462D2F|nr:hypothetical protein [Streptomyces platensis]MCF3142358.1 hypothetical protein [Streptomyces platensis]
MLIRNDYPRRIALGTSGLALLVTVAAVIGVAKGAPRVELLATDLVLLCCAVLAVVGWRKERAWMTFTACAGLLVAVFGGGWLFAE